MGTSAVYINKDGEYAVRSSCRTHGGKSEYITWVTSLQSATVFSVREAMAFKDELLNAVVLPAEELRTVRICTPDQKQQS